MNGARASLRMRAAASIAAAGAARRPATRGGWSSSRKAATSSRQAGQPPSAATPPLFRTSRVNSQGSPQKKEGNRAGLGIAGFYHPPARKSNDGHGQRRAGGDCPGRALSSGPSYLA